MPIDTKKLLAASILIVLVVALGYRYWTRTPGYTLGKIEAAAQNQDVQAFEKYVDIESLCSRIIDDVFATAMAEQTSADSDAEALGQALGFGMINMMKPSLVERFEDGIRQAVENGDLAAFRFRDSAADEQVTLSGLTGKIGVTDQTFSGVEYTETTNAVTRVGLGFRHPQYDEPMVLELKLTDVGPHWRLVELSNLGELLQRISELETEETRRINAERQARIDAILKARSLSKRTTTDRWNIDQKSLIEMIVENTSSHTVRRYHATLQINDSAGRPIKTLKIRDDDAIPPRTTGGGTWVVEHNMFMDDTVVLYETPDSQLTYEVQFTSLELDDGSTIEMLDE